MDKRILLFVAALLLVVAGIFTYKTFLKKKKPDAVAAVNFIVSRTEINEGDAIDYEDRTAGASSWMWEFGDGDVGNQKSGTHKYVSAGDYTILLTVNGKLADSQHIMVKALMAPADTSHIIMASISGPATAFVGDKIVFTDNTPGATTTQWKFGESGGVDGTGKTITYSYESPRTYDVVATNNVSKKPVIHKIRIKPKPVLVASASSGGKPVPAKSAMIRDEDLRAKLQQFSDAGFEFQKYKPLLKYLCGETDDIPVTINGSKTINFNSYCKQLDFLHPKITSVKQNRDPNTNCVISISVTHQ
jgi:hypothetical protein